MSVNQVCLKALLASSFVVSLALAQNTIDAVTSASGTLKLLSGKAYSTYAVVRWQDEYNEGGQSHLIKYGISSVSENSYNLQPFTKNTATTDTLKGLVPQSPYKAEFYRLYKGTAYRTAFSFTTTSATTNIEKKSISTHKTSLSPGTTVALYNQAGRRIGSISSEEYLRAASFRTNACPSIHAAGVYLAQYSDPRSNVSLRQRLIIQQK